MKTRVYLTCLSVIMGVLLLSACGGGGGEPEDSSPQGSHWDQMVWDQDNWA